ncbi:MAG: hypothetical protein PHD81_03245 [Candidatus Nanoarchaeia archaeon]|nr:hypothetical protein [Candidatus Nanoarchaeia archaeon]MDD5588100.1 hypothetical protein [Candidatus Nanoarchaeia archaeon]
MNNKTKIGLYVIIIFCLFCSFLIINHTKFTGFVVLEEVKVENNFNYIKPDIITNDSTLIVLNNAQTEINTMKEAGFGTYFVNDKLLEAKTAYTYGNYEEVFKNTQLITYTKNQAFKILDTISILKDKENEYAKSRINTSLVLEYLAQTESSLKEERYNEADAFAKETELKLERAKSENTRTRELIKLGKNFFLRYWWQIIIFLILLIIASTPIYKYLRVKFAKRKLENLKLELKTLTNLIKELQERAFQKRNIPMSTFKLRSESYKDKIAEIKRKIPVEEAIIKRYTKNDSNRVF